MSPACAALKTRRMWPTRWGGFPRCAGRSEMRWCLDLDVRLDCRHIIMHLLGQAACLPADAKRHDPVFNECEPTCAMPSERAISPALAYMPAFPYKSPDLLVCRCIRAHLSSMRCDGWDGMTCKAKSAWAAAAVEGRSRGKKKHRSRVMTGCRLPFAFILARNRVFEWCNLKSPSRSHVRFMDASLAPNCEVQCLYKLPGKTAATKDRGLIGYKR